MVMETYHADMQHLRKTINNPKFLSKYYSPQEMKFLISKSFSPNIIAEMFCAKLAFRKAMGVTFRGCHLNDVSVLMDYSDTYYISLTGDVQKRFEMKKMRILVSCSHSKTLALSTVMFYE